MGGASFQGPASTTAQHPSTGHPIKFGYELALGTTLRMFAYLLYST